MYNIAKPNILLVLYDGMNADALQPDSDCKTPNFNKLAHGGVSFDNAHSVNPVCSPSRASLMTGVLPHRHGVLQVEHCTDSDQCVLRKEYPHWPERLQEAGYNTGYFGKWHIERTGRLENFGWKVSGMKEEAAFRKIGDGDEGADGMLDKSMPHRYQSGPDGYNTVLHYGVTGLPAEKRMFGHTASEACSFIDASSGSKSPWACCVSFSEPNVPVIAGAGALKSYNIDSIKLPESLTDGFKNSPGLYKRGQEVFSGISARQWRELRAVYYALITELDAQFGIMVDKLEKYNELENTIIVVTADHGRYIGGHGFDNHNIGAFEEAYKIPLIIRGPGVSENVRCNALVSLYDLCPTFLELAGAMPIDGIDAKSFRKILADPDDTEGGHATCYGEYHGTRFNLTQRVLWHNDWKYVFNGFDYDELYNLRTDPSEIKNLARLPEYQQLCRSMMAKIWEKIASSGDKALLGTHYLPLRIASVGPGFRNK